MPQPMTGVLVLVASPGDAAEERAIISDGLLDWNITRGRRDGIALLPWRWEKHAIATLGGRPQELINAQAVDRADVVVAFFDSRLGSATGVDVSGTAEEINRAIDRGKPVHVYFSAEPIHRDVDAEQLVALREFQRDLENRGVLGRYADPADLLGQVIRAVESDIDHAGWSGLQPTSAPQQQTAADLVWEHVQIREPDGIDQRGKMRYRTIRNDLVVSNTGRQAAESLTFETWPVGDTAYVFPGAPSEPVDVHPQSSRSWTLIPTPSAGQSGNTIGIRAKWSEGDTAHTAEWTVAMNG